MANLWFPFELMQVLLLVGYHYLLAFYKLFVPNRRRQIRGQVVLITGAGQGIGRQLALKFAREGANLALWDINEVRSSQVCHPISRINCIVILHVSEVHLCTKTCSQVFCFGDIE